MTRSAIARSALRVILIAAGVGGLGCGPGAVTAREPSTTGERPADQPAAGADEVGFALPPGGAERYSTDIEGAGKLEGFLAELRQQIGAAHRTTLRADARLDDAAAVVASAEEAGIDVTTQLVREVLWWRGVPEAAPVIGLFTGSDQGELAERVLEHLERRVADGGTGYGLAQVAIRGGARVVVLSLRGGIEIQDIPRRVGVGATVQLRGKIDPPHVKTVIAVTDPRGQTNTTRGQMKGRKFSGAFAPDAPGTWQVEILGDGPQGPWVLANFPVAVDVPVAQSVSIRQYELEDDDPREIERLMFDEINASRATHGLEPLARSRKLDKVARAYSKEMKQTGNVGHVSPISGGPGDRAAAAGLSFPRLRENLARAGSAAEAHQGLMRSPAHRANILDPQAYEAGVGVALTEERGDRAILVTELIVSRPEPIDAREVAERILETIAEQRRQAGVGAVRRDRWLDRAAEGLLRGCFDAAADADIDMHGSPFKRVAAIQISAAGLDGALSSDNPVLANEAFRYVGVAAKQGKHPKLGEGMICIRVVFGAK